MLAALRTTTRGCSPAVVALLAVVVALSVAACGSSSSTKHSAAPTTLASYRRCLKSHHLRPVGRGGRFDTLASRLDNPKYAGALTDCGARVRAALSADATSIVGGHGRGSAQTVYYLALGDSVPVWTGPSSYPNRILAHYQHGLPGLRLQNIAVSGETTSSMLEHQYPEAVAFLKAHRRHVALITIDIGGNDIIGCALQVTTAASNSPCSVQARATIKGNLTMIMAGLHAAAPGVPVVGMSYYDPLLGDWLAAGTPRSLALSTASGLVALNRELTSLYGGPPNTADVQHVFRSTNLTTIVSSRWGRIPIAVARACSWLDITCHPGAAEGVGDDPNAAGEAVIATAFERTIDRLCARARSTNPAGPPV